MRQASIADDDQIVSSDPDDLVDLVYLATPAGRHVEIVPV